MKERLLQTIFYTIGAIICGIAYIGWCSISTLRIPCLFYELTDLYCPGCGVTRMCLALVKLDFRMAFYNNRALFICIPFGLILGVKFMIQYIKVGYIKLSLKQTRLLWVIIAFLIMFGVLRNIPRFYYLRPIV